MESLSLILTIVSIVITFISIGITIFGVVIPIQHERKSKLPRLLLTHFVNGSKPNQEEDNKEGTVLHGYFEYHRDFDKKLHEFLAANDSDIEFMTSNFMEYVVENYNKKNYYEEAQYHPTIEINHIIKTFKDNPKFIKLINEYIAYSNNSRWILKITNVGQTSAFDLTINLFKENNSGAKYLDGTLKPDEIRKIIVYYFDKAAMLNSDKKSLYWKGEKSTLFYLVDDKKYNKKDERLFLITYRDVYGKDHKFYCCSKIGKNNFQNIMGAKQ